MTFTIGKTGVLVSRSGSDAITRAYIRHAREWMILCLPPSLRDLEMYQWNGYYDFSRHFRIHHLVTCACRIWTMDYFQLGRLPLTASISVFSPAK